MSEQDQQAAMTAWLRTIGWDRGVTKAELLDRLRDEDGPRQVINLYLPEGTYFSPEDVLNVLPAQAWQDAQGMTWRGGEPPVAAIIQGDFANSPVAELEAAAEQAAAASANSAAAGEQADGGQPGAAGAKAGAIAQVRQAAQAVTQTAGQAAQAVTDAAGQAAQAVGQTAAKVAEQTKERAGTVAQSASGIAELPDRVRQTATQARDQVLTVRTRAADVPGATAADPAAAPKAPRPAVAVALSSVVEGLGQAYNRQPGKAVLFALIGLTLSTVSGLNTWLARRVLRNPDLRIGPERVRPVLLGVWSATFAFNLWDAWSKARRGPASDAGVTATPSWSSLDPDRAGPSTATAAAATDEYPTVGTS